MGLSRRSATKGSVIGFILAMIMSAGFAFADGTEPVMTQDEVKSKALPAAIASMPAVWEAGLVTQMGVARDANTALALSVSTKIADNVLLKAVWAVDMETENDVIAGSVTIRW